MGGVHVATSHIVASYYAIHDCFPGLAWGKSREGKMQSLASYAVKVDISGDAKISRINALNDKIDAWLRDKGVGEPRAESGEFISKSDRDKGFFSRKFTESNVGNVLDIRLSELDKSGALFSTSISLFDGASEVCVYCNMSLEAAHGVLAPLSVHPKCPRIVRDIITSFDDWEFGGNGVPTGRVLDRRGASGGQDLCRLIQDNDRSVPVLAIAVDKKMIWPYLPDVLAREMIGLVNVVIVDEESSWVMTSELGKLCSCYLGAIRLYWPHMGGSGKSGSGFVWTASRLQDEFGENEAGMKRFMSNLSSDVMSVAALAISPPRGIREVHLDAMRTRIKQMEKSVIETELNSIMDEHSRLSADLEEEKARNSRLSMELNQEKSRVSYLEQRLLQLQCKLDDRGIDVGVPQNEAEDDSPSDGEIRYYKKTGSGGGVDKMVRTKSCNHNSWQSAFKGDQAEKGILKLEGRKNWKSIQHCGACTGGGMWKVHW
jgi:hypothetical protein